VSSDLALVPVTKCSERTDVSREETPSLPGTPSKKRVRYADEEQLPLETFEEPSPNQYVPVSLQVQQVLTSSIPSPPKKKPKPLLLEAPSTDDDVPDANKFTYKAPGSYKEAKTGVSPEPASVGEGSVVDSVTGEDEDDEFARMVRTFLG
jgi:RNA polymerase II subunit A-like phosphatase